MRKKNSIFNIISSIVLQLVMIGINLITQRVFVDTLGLEMLGLRGLFNNIISILNLADLGLGTAIVYNMYKPLAEGDHIATVALLNFYSKIYRIIALVITLLGLFFIPFIGFFISESIDTSYAQIIFLFFIARTALTYLFSYKVNLFVADQKRYVYTNITLIFVLLINISSILILKLTQNYLLFLSVNIFLIFLQNVLISFMADRAYPYIKKYSLHHLQKETKLQIISNTKALIFQRFGYVCVNATDNLVLARMADLLQVGLLSNYTLITTTVRNLLAQFFIAITASMGNLIAQEDWKNVEIWFWRIMFGNFWVFGFGSISLLVLLSPFVNIWMGTSRVLEPIIIFLLVLHFYLQGMNQCTKIIRDCAGLYRQLRFMPLLEGIVNLVTSIILANWFGVTGVLLGTLIGCVTCSVWVFPQVVFNTVLNSSLNIFYKKYVLYFITVIIAGIITWYLCNLVIFSNIYITFIIKMVICLLLPNLLFSLLFWKDSSFIYFRNLFLDILKRIFKFKPAH